MLKIWEKALRYCQFLASISCTPSHLFMYNIFKSIWNCFEKASIGYTADNTSNWLKIAKGWNNQYYNGFEIYL